MVVQDSVKLTDRLTAVGGLRWENWQQESGMGRPFVPTLARQRVALQFGRLCAHAGADRLREREPLVQAERRHERRGAARTGIRPRARGRAEVQPEAGDHRHARGLPDRQAQRRGHGGRSHVDDRHRALARIELDVAGQITRHLSVIGSYAYTNATDRDSNTPLTNVARHTGSLFAVYDTAIANPPAGASVAAHDLSAHVRDTANSFTLPGYVTVDAFAAYETTIGKFPTRFQLNVKNLLDKTYYPSSNNNLIIAVGEPRLVTLTTTVSF